MIEFKSKAAATFTMLDAHGEQLLALLDKTRGQRGVIMPDEIPDALRKLRAAIERERAQLRDAVSDDVEQEPAVGLERRAWPLIEMLESAGRAGTDVHWGY